MGNFKKPSNQVPGHPSPGCSPHERAKPTRPSAEPREKRPKDIPRTADDSSARQCSLSVSVQAEFVAWAPGRTLRTRLVVTVLATVLLLAGRVIAAAVMTIVATPWFGPAVAAVMAS